MLLSILSLGLAQEVLVQLDPAVASQAGVDQATVEQEFRGSLDGMMHTDDLSGFLSQMASANLLSTRGMGVDYASAMQRFAIGGSFGTATSAGGFRFGGGDSAVPETGFAFQIMAMAGLNLGAFSEDDSPLRRFRIYGNGMKAGTQRDQIAGDFLNWGAHLQVNLIKNRKATAVEWGGIDLTTGLESSSYVLTLEQALPVDFGAGKWDADGEYTLTARGMTVPVELSTSLRLAIFSAFVGGALDTNVSGQADNTIELDGPLTTTVDGKSATLGSASATFTASGLAGKATPRFFWGAQLNIAPVKVYGQVNVTADDSVGGHLGVRLVL